MTAEDEGTDREKIVRTLYAKVIYPAEVTLSEARHDIQLAKQDSKTDYQATLTAAYNSLRDASRKSEAMQSMYVDINENYKQ